MNRETSITLKPDASAAWSDDAVSSGCDPHPQRQSRDTVGEWEANYLLPQLVPGVEYPVRDTKALLSGLLKRLSAGSGCLA